MTSGGERLWAVIYAFLCGVAALYLLPILGVIAAVGFLLGWLNPAIYLSRYAARVGEQRTIPELFSACGLPLTAAALLLLLELLLAVRCGRWIEGAMLAGGLKWRNRASCIAAGFWLLGHLCSIGRKRTHKEGT